MIFVTVGGTRNDFRRLLEEVDRLTEHGLLRDVFAQIGASAYQPIHYTHCSFMPREEWEEKIQEAAFVICHAGTGTLDICLGHGKKVIMVPRCREYGEHPDNHQSEVAQYLSSRNRALLVHDIRDLAKQVRAIPAWTPSFRLDAGSPPLLLAVRDFLVQGLGLPPVVSPRNSS